VIFAADPLHLRIERHDQAEGIGIKAIARGPTNTKVSIPARSTPLYPRKPSVRRYAFGGGALINRPQYLYSATPRYNFTSPNSNGLTSMLRSCLRLLAVAGGVCAVLAAPVLGTSRHGPVAEPSPAGAALNSKFDAALSAKDQSDWLKLMAAEPNHVGSPHDKANAEWELEQFKKFGWDAHIEEFDILYPTPIAEKLELLTPTPFDATLQETPIPGDGSATETQPALPAYLAYQGDGDVTAPIVYVNYGMQEDYTALERMGIDVKGKIVIARYGHGWRGLKPLLAQQHGAVGCIIYSDPANDGYAQDTAYPDGPMRPAQGIQRGSVEDSSIMDGDPLTPGWGATKDAKRLAIKDSPAILKIPALPISYADARHFLETLTGNVVPESWRGALPITYRVGPSSVNVHLLVKSDWSLKPAYDVVAEIKGSEFPDQWVIRGNHHDGWVEGATDPLSGQVALLDEAKAIGALVTSGWKPKRTIIYVSWDAEEPGTMGSVEWGEEHADDLKKHAVLYINSDTNERGILDAGGSQDLTHFVDSTLADLIDPETKAGVLARRRAGMRVSAESGDDPLDTFAAKLAADPAKNVPIDPIGSGSDYGVFYDHLGIEALSVEYDGEGRAGGVYHSRYDTWAHHTRFVDPGMVYGVMLSKSIGRLVLAAADTPLPLQRVGDFAAAVRFYLDDIKKLVKKKREAATQQAAMLKDNIYALAADPTKTSGNPTPLKPVPKIDMKPLDAAVTRLSKAAKAYDAAIVAHGDALPAAKKEALFALMRNIDATLSPDAGILHREWYKNLVYAPGRYTGYDVKTLPGVREAIEEERWSDADASLKTVASAFGAYSARLEQAVKLIIGR
jgi:N-acetylated-alpha-linked acidic dipeptidase